VTGGVVSRPNAAPQRRGAARAARAYAGGMNTALVVYYSRSGTTRAVARELAAALHADVEELHDRVDRAGTLGYLRTGAEQLLGTSTEIDLPRHDPARYDLVVIGSPVFVGAPCAAVRTYLWLERAHLPRTAFFVTFGGSWADRALRQMAALAGKEPAATLALRQREVAGDGGAAAAAGFVRSLAGAPTRAPARRRARRAAR
jgi:flavodoxin